MKTILLLMNLIGAVLSLLSALYWYRSARTKLPDVDPATGRPNGSVSMLEIHKTVVEGAAANKLAAAWTAAATLVFALSSILGALSAA